MSSPACAVPRLPGTDDKLVSPLDAVILWAALVLFVSSVLAAVLSALFLDTGWIVSASFASVPFLALGIYGFLRERRLVPLALVLSVSAVLYVIGPLLSQISLVILVCSEGVAVLAESLQRLLFFRLCHRLEFLSIKKKEDLADRVIRFFLGIPEGYDTRNLVMDPHVLRDRFPWRDVSRTAMLALLISVAAMLTVAVFSAYPDDVSSNIPVIMTFALYASALSVPFFILGSVDLGLRSGRKVFSVSDGFSGTVGRMLLSGLLALAVVAVFARVGPDRLLTVLSCVLAVSAVAVMSSSAYCIRVEAGIVRDIAGIWESELPLGRFEQKRERRAEDSGAPGTPVRDCRSCYRNLKGQ